MAKKFIKNLVIGGAVFLSLINVMTYYNTKQTIKYHPETSLKQIEAETRESGKNLEKIFLDGNESFELRLGIKAIRYTSDITYYLTIPGRMVAYMNHSKIQKFNN